MAETVSDQHTHTALTRTELEGAGEGRKGWVMEGVCLTTDYSEPEVHLKAGVFEPE